MSNKANCQSVQSSNSPAVQANPPVYGPSKLFPPQVLRELTESNARNVGELWDRVSRDSGKYADRAARPRKLTGKPRSAFYRSERFRDCVLEIQQNAGRVSRECSGRYPGFEELGRIAALLDIMGESLETALSELRRTAR